MTHNLSSTESNITAENQSGRLQEISLECNNQYLDSENKLPNAAYTSEISAKDREAQEASHQPSSFEEKSIIEGENEKFSNSEFRFGNEKVSFWNLQRKKNELKDSLPIYGLCEKGTQTYLTSRDIDEYEALKTAPPHESIASLFKFSPDLIKKIYGSQNIFGTPNEKFFENLRYNFNGKLTALQENTDINCGSTVKAYLLNKTLEKNFDLNLQRKDEFMKDLLGRKRKNHPNYEQLNKNGLHEKHLLKTDELQKYSGKLEPLKDLGIESDSHLLANFGFVSNFFVPPAVVSTNFPNNIKSTNKILIRRKFDNRKKKKIKEGKAPHRHSSLNAASVQHKSIVKNGIAKNKKLNKNVNNFNIEINKPDQDDSCHELKEDLCLNLNESDKQFGIKDKNKVFKNEQNLEFLPNLPRNSIFNFVEKGKNLTTVGNENVISSVNDDFSKSSYEASLAKGISSFNEDLIELNIPLTKDFNNEIEFFNETESKFGKARSNKNVSECYKKIDEDSRKQQNNSISNLQMRYDSSVKLAEETCLFNLDNQKESKMKNINNHKQKSISKPAIERISKKFDPYQYFKNECIQSHKNKEEDEIERECQVNWKNMDKELKAVYFRMAEHEKKTFKKIRKLNSLSIKEKGEN